MRILIALACALVLAGCTSPSPRFAGTARQEVSVEGSRFIVFHRGDEVEVHRVSPEFLPRQRDVFLRAIMAIETVTGCALRPRSLTGDQAILRASVDCPPGP